MSTRFVAPLITLFALLFLSFGAPIIRALDILLKHQLHTFTLILPITAALLGLFFGRAKVFYLALLLLFWQLLFLFPHLFALSKQSPNAMLSYLMPISFLLLGLLSERGIFSKPGSLRLVLSVLLGVLSWLLLSNPTWSKELSEPLFSLTFSTPASHLSLILLTLSFLMLFIFGILESKQSEKVLPWVLIIASLSFLVPSPIATALASLLFIIALIQDAYKMAYVDTLTNIPSRRALEEYFSKLSPPFSVAMVDIDHFKSFNDTYGHDIGDDVLRMVATTLSKVEGGGKAFRYGGEEFTIVFGNKNVKEAKVYLEALRETIAQRGFALRKTPRPKTAKGTKNRSKKPATKTVSLTVSMGACDTSHSPIPTQLIKKADTLLYKAKQAGRNCLKL